MSISPLNISRRRSGIGQSEAGQSEIGQSKAGQSGVGQPREASDSAAVKAPTAPVFTEVTKTPQPSDPVGAKTGVVAVIPAYNEERFIASVVFKTRQYAETVIVVDDGSSDLTARLAEQAGAEVVRQPENRGKAAALNAGFRAAQHHAPSVVVCLDADAQHEPADIPLMVAPVLGGHADVVIGSRFLETRSDIPQWRQVGQHTLTAVTNVLSGVQVSDSQSGFRAFSPAAVTALRFSSAGLSVESEMQFLFGPAGLRIAEAPISVSYKDGNKRNPVVHGLAVLDAMIGLVARRRPLLFISLPGFVVSCLGVLLGLFVAFRMDQTGQLMVGSSILTVLLVIGGLLLAVTGVMLHSISHFVGRLREEFHLAQEFRVATDEPTATPNDIGGESASVDRSDSVSSRKTA